MKKKIDLDKLNDLLKEYKDFKHKDKTFEEFIENTEDDSIPVWDWVDCVGVLTKADFENDFTKKYIEDNFEDLAHLWFNGLNAQVDLGIVLECVKDEMKG